ncbi:CAP domain-containing protein [Streptomyces goshikiensis]|uniref:CAP domain-containing protein n=1 Tax=Streptomyces goshikiensis TaxID=1942 RepID=UPI00369B483D
MQKHRKRTHYKKISIAAITLGIVGIPTAAMACLDNQDSGATHAAGRHGARPSHGAPAPSAPVGNLAGFEGAPVETATATPAESASPTAAATPTEEATPSTQTTAPSTAPAKPPVTTKPAKPKPRPTAPVTSAKPTTPTAAPSGPAAEVVALVNQERAKAGCSALTVNPKLTAAALNHSQDMASHNNMSHTGSDGSDPGERITRAGYGWMSYGENVAYGYSSPEQVMEGWMNSPGHRENILNCSFKEIGVGLAQPNSYWTQDFGTAR